MPNQVRVTLNPPVDTLPVPYPPNPSYPLPVPVGNPYPWLRVRVLVGTGTGSLGVTRGLPVVIPTRTLQVARVGSLVGSSRAW